MLKKLFRNLTKSSEERRREDCQQKWTNVVSRLSSSAPRLAAIARQFAQAKRQVDESKSLHQAGEKQNVDFDELAEAVCDRAHATITRMSKTSVNFEKAFASTDPAKLSSHMEQWQAAIDELHGAYASLVRAASDKVTPELQETTDGYDTSTPLGQAVESLLLEVRTAERIRTELGG